ncbi:MAG: hypothetical protein AVDCRST_MAG04-3680, partial [uncultured Acetobacteraceae bacterium]
DPLRPEGQNGAGDRRRVRHRPRHGHPAGRERLQGGGQPPGRRPARAGSGGEAARRGPRGDRRPRKRRRRGRLRAHGGRRRAGAGAARLPRKQRRHARHAHADSAEGTGPHHRGALGNGAAGEPARRLPLHQGRGAGAEGGGGRGGQRGLHRRAGLAGQLHGLRGDQGRRHQHDQEPGARARTGGAGERGGARRGGQPLDGGVDGGAAEGQRRKGAAQAPLHAGGPRRGDGVPAGRRRHGDRPDRRGGRRLDAGGAL